MNVSQVTNDILNNPRFEGAIESITWLTDWTDVGFGMAITFVAFLIILVAMFKNVLAAAYCAYPKFWDHVNQAHENKKDTNFIAQMGDVLGQARGGNIGAVNGGSVGEIILGIIPDIKHMTDFEGDNISAKHYFMRAIPQMIVCVCLGAFIYNGTYRDVAGRVVDFGTELINRTLLEFDPIAVYDGFTGTAGRPTFRTDNAVRADEKQINQVATKLYTAVIGTYSDIKSADQKRLLADWAESQATEIVAGWKTIQIGDDIIAPTENEETFSLSVDMSWSTSTNIAVGMVEERSARVSQNPVTYQLGWCLACDPAVVGSDMAQQAPYILVRLVATKTDSVRAGVGIQDGILYLDAGSNTTIATSAQAGSVYVQGMRDVGTQLTGTTDNSQGNDRRVLTYSGDELSVTWTLVTKDSQGNSTQHKITKIMPAGNGHASGTVASAAGDAWGSIQATPGAAAVTPPTHVNDSSSNQTTTPPEGDG